MNKAVSKCNGCAECTCCGRSHEKAIEWHCDVCGEETNELYFNEINTIPGSLSFYLWEPTGLKYTDLLDQIIQMALKRARKDRAMTFTFQTNILDQNAFGGAKGSKM